MSSQNKNILRVEDNQNAGKKDIPLNLSHRSENSERFPEEHPPRIFKQESDSISESNKEKEESSLKKYYPYKTFSQHMNDMSLEFKLARDLSILVVSKISESTE